MLGILLSTAIISKEEMGRRAGLGGKTHRIRFWSRLFQCAEFFKWMEREPGREAAGRAPAQALPCARHCSGQSPYLRTCLIFTTNLGRDYYPPCDR